MSTHLHRVRELGSAIARGDTAFFVGAGLSAGAGLPLWSQLVDELRAGLTPTSSEMSPQLVAQFFRNQHGDYALFTLLRKALWNNRIAPSAAHRLLCSFPVRVFFTTNYDNLIEATLRNTGKPVHVISNDHEVGLWNESEEFQVVKVHGDLDNSSSIVLTEEDYVRFLFENKAIQRKLLDTFSFRTVVFVGYNLSDPDITQIYNNILYELGALKRPAYILTFENDAHKIREWERRKIFPLTIPAPAEMSKHDAFVRYLTEVKQEVARAQHQAPCDILIVEDDPDNQNILQAYLSMRYSEARIDCAQDGLEALMLIAKNHPRVILVDLLMPRMDGWELIELLRSDLDLKTTTIVVVSALTVDHSRAEALGVAAVLPKPVELRELGTFLDRYLHSPQRAA